MKSLLLAVFAGTLLAGCIAVPAPYYSDAGYYSPGVAVGVYSGPAYYGHGHRHHHRHRGRW